MQVDSNQSGRLHSVLLSYEKTIIEIYKIQARISEIYYSLSRKLLM